MHWFAFPAGFDSLSYKRGDMSAVVVTVDILLKESHGVIAYSRFVFGREGGLNTTPAVQDAVLPPCIRAKGNKPRSVESDLLQ